MLISHGDIECVFARDQDIPRYVEHGALDCGLTGREWINESASRVISVAQLVCAKRSLVQTSWVLAVSDESKYQSAEDLAEKIVITELVRTTRDYFSARNIPLTVELARGPLETHLPVLGDAIVGNLETAVSLRNGHFRILGTVLQSATEFITNEQTWADKTRRNEIESLALMLRGDLHAQEHVGMMFTVRKSDLAAALRLFPPGQKSSISPLSDEAWVTVNTVIEEATSWNIIGALKAARAETIVEFPLKKVLL